MAADYWAQERRENGASPACEAGKHSMCNRDPRGCACCWGNRCEGWFDVEALPPLHGCDR